MKTYILLCTLGILANVNGFFNLMRPRREVAGTLDIVSNNIQPIHEDVHTEITSTEKPCSTGYVPSQIEPGIVFQVTPPLTSFQQSLRKSLNPLSTIELVKSVSRLVTVVVLSVSALIELYPALVGVVSALYGTVE